MKGKGRTGEKGIERERRRERRGGERKEEEWRGEAIYAPFSTGKYTSWEQRLT